MGLVPLITGGGPPVADATALSAVFNTGLAAAIDDIATLFPDTNLFQFDTFGLLTDAFLDPSAFGFTNVTDACYSEFVVPGGTSCANPDEFLSWDGFHPTTATHRIIAEQVVVPVPAAAWLFVSGLIGLLGLARRRHE
jgi:phospholipase/lecithinase/hemolysin